MPRTPLHSPRGFIVHSKPGAHDCNSYFPLPVRTEASSDATIATADSTNIKSTDRAHSALPAEQVNDVDAVSTCAVQRDILEPWAALGGTVHSDNGSISSNVAKPASLPEKTVVSVHYARSNITFPQSMPEVSCHSFEEHFILSTKTTTPKSIEVYDCHHQKLTQNAERQLRTLQWTQPSRYTTTPKTQVSSSSQTPRKSQDQHSCRGGQRSLREERFPSYARILVRHPTRHAPPF